MARTPNYITTKEVIIDNGPQDKQILPAGASVRPIEHNYLPKETLEKYKFGIPQGQQMCYTRFGLVPIRKEWIREV